MCELVHIRLSRLTSEPALGDYKIGDPVDPFPGFEIGEDEGAVAAHAFGVAVHDFEARADLWGEIDLVDDEEVGAGYARSALSSSTLPVGAARSRRTFVRFVA